jgi:hypothetical protein
MKNLLLIISLFSITALHAQTAGDYRSIASGDWNVVTNWERFDGAVWQPAATAPASTDGIVTVVSLNVITANTSVTADQLVIDAGASLIITSAFTVANGTGTDLSVNGTLQVAADLSGPGTTSVAGTFDWTTGTVSTATTITAAGSMLISGAGAKAVNSSITNNGTITWSAGNLDFNAGSVINNGTFVTTFDGTINNTTLTNSFTNSGTLQKSAGTGITTIAIPLTNSGSIVVATGTLLKSATTTTLNAGSTFSGNGTLSFSGAIALNTAINVPATLVLSQLPTSVVTGAGSMTINGTMNWQGNSIGSAYTIASGAVLNISGSGTKVINSAATLTNNGTINWSAGAIRLDNGTLTNTGSIDQSFDGGLNPFTGTNAFNNSGSFTKSGGTVGTGITAPMYNSGSINVNSGSIITSGILHLNPGTVLTGTGTFGIDGTVTVNTTVNPPATLTIRKQGGSTTGTGTFNILGTMNWTTGSIGSPFHIQSTGVLSLNTGTSRSLNNTLTNDGTINWTLGSIDFNNGTLNNNGIFNAYVDNIFNNTSGTNLLSNTATLNKVGGSGSSTFAIPVVNSGTINVSTGTIVNSGNSFLNTGTINIGASRTFSNTGTLMLQTGTAITGSGSLSTTGLVQLTTNVSIPSTVTLNVLTGSSSLGAGVMTVNGTMNWSGGTIGSPFTIASTGTVNASGATKTLSSTLTNGGSFLWTAGDIDFNNGTLVNNGTINQSFDGTMVNASGTNAFSNVGTLSKTGGTSATINIPSTNTGIINGSNTLNFAGTFTNNGTIAPGRPMGIISVTSSVSPLLTSNSNLSIEMLNGTGAGTGHDQLLQSSNLVLAGTLTVTETGVTPAGDYTIVSLSAGTISGSFATVSAPAAYMVIVNPTNIILRKNILPLNWLSFTGTSKPGSIMLNWKTANERNTKAFEVQRSVDGRNFVAIGNVKAKALNEEKDYTFEDLSYAAGMNYYRLKQTDIDGLFEYSKTIAVRTEAAVKDIQIYPNPAKGAVSMQIPEEWKSSDVMIRSLSGQLVREYKNITQGTLQLELPRGTYYVQFSKENKIVTRQIRIN